MGVEAVVSREAPYLVHVGGEAYTPCSPLTGHYIPINDLEAEHLYLFRVRPHHSAAQVLRKLIENLGEFSDEPERVNLLFGPRNRTTEINLAQILQQEEFDFFVKAYGAEHLFRFSYRNGEVYDGEKKIDDNIRIGNVFGDKTRGIELQYVGSPGVRFRPRRDEDVAEAIYTYYDRRYRRGLISSLEWEIPDIKGIAGQLYTFDLQVLEQIVVNGLNQLDDIATELVGEGGCRCDSQEIHEYDVWHALERLERKGLVDEVTDIASGFFLGWNYRSQGLQETIDNHFSGLSGLAERDPLAAGIVASIVDGPATLDDIILFLKEGGFGTMIYEQFIRKHSPFFQHPRPDGAVIQEEGCVSREYLVARGKVTELIAKGVIRVWENDTFIPLKDSYEVDPHARVFRDAPGQLLLFAEQSEAPQ